MTETATPVVFRVGDQPGRHLTGIPWAMIAQHERQAQRNHFQSLQRLHDRGGLVWSEALAVIEDRAWSNVPDAKARVLAAVELWKGEQ